MKSLVATRDVAPERRLVAKGVQADWTFLIRIELPLDNGSYLRRYRHRHWLGSHHGDRRGEGDTSRLGKPENARNEERL